MRGRKASLQGFEVARTAQREIQTLSPVRFGAPTCHVGGGDRTSSAVPAHQLITQSVPLRDTRYASKYCGQVQIRSFGQGPERRAFNELQTFQFRLEEGDAEVWCIEGPFGIETHAENEHDIRSDIDDYLCYLWRTYVESDELMTTEAARLRSDLLQAVST